MKKLVFLIPLLWVSILNAQTTLKITAINSPDDALYNQWAEKYLGKQMNITFYDNSVNFSVGSLTSNLRLVSSNLYSADLSKSTGEKVTGTLSISSTLSVVTSATFKITIQELKGKQRRTYVQMIGKRF
ncbi:hypothetical protein [Pedobacter sp. SL55]|uniref:hypothetical protein n=1 Tax=Pedobacter sp. SL55 TaxID=2995161 RepID=UPI00226F08B3|nr:hypothetical protein [Pedobacter sp. SL55]WAC41073.1 hypothetical protein OVA16_01465 [Pedobacter sp. SL55]